jgi:predicted nucleotidyltransferase
MDTLEKVKNRTILLVRHGSHAYGTNIVGSDLDVKGVCIETKEYFYGFNHVFEQLERSANKGNEYDLVVMSLRKFAKLATECNPSIIEILYVDDKDVLFADSFGEELRAEKNIFLSAKAKHTFSGYAHAQLKRIKTHRAWLLNPPKNKPERSDFGLKDTTKISKSELGAFDNLIKDNAEVELPKDVVILFLRERQYQTAKTQYEQYQNWKKNRNEARAQMESKFGYDCKHGMHLIRLMRMCKEILTEGRVNVRRHDNEELLSIRRGEWTYDRLIEHADLLEAECDALYKTTELPHGPDRVRIDRFVIDMTERYLSKHG